MIDFTPIHILFTIKSIKLYTHGFLMALAFLISSFLASRHFKNKDEFWNLMFFSFLGSIIGARLLYVIFYYQQFTSFIQVFQIWQGGLVSYGGLIGGFLSAYIFIKHKNLNFLEYADKIAPYIALGLAIGRIGCFLNWDDYGTASNLPWAVNVDFPRHPTQIYHSIADFIIFLILKPLQKKNLKKGSILFLFILLYSIFRFIVDFFRDYPFKWLFLFPSQWLSLLVIIIVVIIAFKYKLFKKK